MYSMDTNIKVLFDNLPLKAKEIVTVVAGKDVNRNTFGQEVKATRLEDGNYNITCNLESKDGDCYTFMCNSSNPKQLSVFINDQFYKSYEWDVKV